MPLPSDLKSLAALKGMLKELPKKLKAKNVDSFEVYAEDATTFLGKSYGTKIMSFKKTLLGKNAEKKAAAFEKIVVSFKTFSDKVEARIVKIKEVEQKKKEAEKAKALALKAKEAAKKEKLKAKEAAKKEKAKKSKKPKAKKVKKSTSPKEEASYMWGGEYSDEEEEEDEENSDLDF